MMHPTQYDYLPLLSCFIHSDAESERRQIRHTIMFCSFEKKVDGLIFGPNAEIQVD